MPATLGCSSTAPTRTPSRTSPGRRIRTSSAASVIRTRPCDGRPSSTTSSAWRSPPSWALARHTVWIGDGGNYPGQVHARRALERYLESLREIYAALPDGCRLLLEHKLYEPAFYSTVLERLGHELRLRPGARRPRVLARGSRPPRAEHQHRADCRAAHSARKARRVSFQRQQIRRRRPRRGIDQALSAVPHLQRAGGCGARGSEGVRSVLHAGPVARGDRSDRVAGDERDRAGPRAHPGAPGGSRRAGLLSGAQRRADGAADAEAGVYLRRVADSRDGAAARGWGDRSRLARIALQDIGNAKRTSGPAGATTCRRESCRDGTASACRAGHV